MQQASPDLLRRLKNRSNRPGNFTQILGLVVTELTYRRAVGTVSPTPENCNPRGIIHGGALFSVMDQLAGLAACTNGCGTVTTNYDGFIGSLDIDHNGQTFTANFFADEHNGTPYLDITDNEGNSVDPQLKQTKPNSWYDTTARTLADLSSGTTNADDEESIINLISQCKTYQDIMLLTEAYSKYDSWTLQKMVNFELNGKGQKEKLNANLKKNGCTYQF